MIIQQAWEEGHLPELPAVSETQVNHWRHRPRPSLNLWAAFSGQPTLVVPQKLWNSNTWSGRESTVNYLQITIMPEVGLGTAARLPKGPGENDSKGFQGRGRGGGGRRGGRGAGGINVGAGWTQCCWRPWEDSRGCGDPVEKTLMRRWSTTTRLLNITFWMMNWAAHCILCTVSYWINCLTPISDGRRLFFGPCPENLGVVCK